MYGLFWISTKGLSRRRAARAAAIVAGTCVGHTTSASRSRHDAEELGEYSGYGPYPFLEHIAGRDLVHRKAIVVEMRGRHRCARTPRSRAARHQGHDCSRASNSTPPRAAAIVRRREDAHVSSQPRFVGWTAHSAAALGRRIVGRRGADREHADREAAEHRLRTGTSPRIAGDHAHVLAGFRARSRPTASATPTRWRRDAHDQERSRG